MDMWNTFENKENPVGAKKRKSYQRRINEIRAATPADSGFQDSSEASIPPLTSISNLSSSHIDDSSRRSSTDRPSTTSPPPSTVRISNRAKKVKERGIKKLSDEQIFKNFLVMKRILRARESLLEQLARWQPSVVLERLADEEIEKFSNKWNFIDNLNFFESMTFRGEVVAQETALDTMESRVFVRWTPNGILDDGWIDESDFPKQGTLIRKLQHMTWRQKLKIRDKLFAGR